MLFSRKSCTDTQSQSQLCFRDKETIESKMTRTKQAARRGNLNKPQKKKLEDGPPPSKKAKKNPPPSSTSLDTSNTIQIQPPPPSATAAPQLISAPAIYQSHNAVPSEHCTPVGDLGSTHDITSMSIISSSHIQQKVARVLEILSTYPSPAGEKPRVVMMHAKAPCAAKMISIAEIGKREVAKEGGKWFQYNRVEGVMVELKDGLKEEEKGKGKESGNKDKVEGKRKDDEVGEAETEEESTAFETMKTPFERANEGKPTMRAVPVMILFLSRVRIDSLRKAYGSVLDHPRHLHRANGHSQRTNQCIATTEGEGLESLMLVGISALQVNLLGLDTRSMKEHVKLDVRSVNLANLSPSLLTDPTNFARIAQSSQFTSPRSLYLTTLCLISS